MLRYEELNKTTLGQIPRQRSAVFIPVGPLEQHGPHLPLGLDAMNARFLSEKMGERLEKKFKDWTFVLFPTTYLGSDTLTHTGTIETPPKLLRAVLLNICKHLANDGFKTLILVGAHGGPRHVVVLEEVASRVSWRYRARAISASSGVFSDLMNGKFISRLSTKLDEKQRQAVHADYHGGCIETSMMLAQAPELVTEEYKNLSPVLLSSPWKIRRTSGKKEGLGLGYLGSPQHSSSKLGQTVIDQFLDEMEPKIEGFLKGEKSGKDFRSIFYYIPLLRTDFKLVLIIAIYIFAFGLALHFLNRNLLEFYK